MSFRAYTEADTMPPAIAGWDGLTLERRDEPRSCLDQALYLYTDIATAGDVSFLEKYKGIDDGSQQCQQHFIGRVCTSFPGRTDTAARDDYCKPCRSAGTFDGVTWNFHLYYVGWLRLSQRMLAMADVSLDSPMRTSFTFDANRL